MLRKLKQFKQNFSKNEEVFNNKYKVVQLGIQTDPGIKFKINNGEELTIGKTGIYELSLGNSIYITQLEFLQDVEAIVDILYEEEM